MIISSDYFRSREWKQNKVLRVEFWRSYTILPAVVAANRLLTALVPSVI